MIKKYSQFASTEGCGSFALLYQIKSKSYSKLGLGILPITLHFFLILIKLVVVIQDFKFQQICYLTCLVCQVVELGVLALYYGTHDPQFIQTIMLTQYILLFQNKYWKEAIVLMIFYTIPIVVYQIGITPFELIYTFSILVIVIFFSVWKHVPLQLIIPKENEQEQNLIVNQLSSRVKGIYDQITFLNDESFLVFNHKLECIHDKSQLQLDQIGEMSQDQDLNKQSNINQTIIQYLFDTKVGSMSHELKNMLQNNSLLQNRQESSSRHSPDLRYLCQFIVQQDLINMKFYSLGNLKNTQLELNSDRINIYTLRDVVDLYLIIHIEKPQTIVSVPGPQFTKSYQSNQTRLNDSISSKLICNIFSSISHEFGTHLNCIVTMGELAMQDEQIALSVKECYLTPMIINARLLSQILTNIRDFNSILVQSFELRISEFNPYDQIMEVRQLIQQQIEQRGNKLIINGPQNLKINNDQDRFKNVVYQLCSNAIRFTQNGTINIDISTLNGLLNITISDTGIGMTLQEQARLSEVLQDNRKMIKISQNSVGCGLGLTISNAIVTTMGSGKHKGISFKSKYNEGSQFTFCITLQAPYTESIMLNSQTFIRILTNPYNFQFVKSEMCSVIQSQSQISQGPNSRQIKLHQIDDQSSPSDIHDNNSSYIDSLANEILPQRLGSIMQVPIINIQLRDSVLQYSIESNCCSRVLIVDDEYFNILSVQMILFRFKAKTDKAFNGQQALDMARKKSQQPCQSCKNWGYSLYFLDINMPVLDGIETAKQLKLSMKQNQIPKGLCIANTGYSDMDTKQQAMQAGMDYYITKPIDLKVLEQYLREMFHKN